MYLGEGRIWKEYPGRHVERVIKPLKAHATSSAGHVHSETSGASIKRLRPTPRVAPAGRPDDDMETDLNRDCGGREGGRVEQIETAMSSQIASGQIRRRFRRMEGAPQNARCPRVLAQRLREVETRSIRSQNPDTSLAGRVRRRLRPPATLSDLIRGRRSLAVSF